MRPACNIRHMHITRSDAGVVYNYIIPVKCKCWECPTCRRRKSQLVQQFIRKNFSHKSLWMITLTLPHRGDVSDSWREIGSQWNVFLTYVRARFGNFDYVRVIEPHLSGGWPHMHILVTKPILNNETMRHLTECGFGWKCHSTRVSVEGSARYVSKYLTKDWPNEQVHTLRRESGCRIVQASRGLGPIFFTVTSWRCVNYNVDLLKLPDIVEEIFYDAIAAGAFPVWYEINNGAHLIRSPVIQFIATSSIVYDNNYADGCGVSCCPGNITVDGVQQVFELI